MEKTNKKVKHIRGGKCKDERGSLSFVNDFDFSNVRRFYMVENRDVGVFRGWHGHKNEAKYVFLVKGRATLAAVEIDDWDKPSKDLEIITFELDEKRPSVVYIPKGFANGFKSQASGTKVIFFSTSTLKESKADDIRFPPEYWKL